MAVDPLAAAALGLAVAARGRQRLGVHDLLGRHPPQLRLQGPQKAGHHPRPVRHQRRRRPTATASGSQSLQTVRRKKRQRRLRAEHPELPHPAFFAVPAAAVAEAKRALGGAAQGPRLQMMRVVWSHGVGGEPARRGGRAEPRRQERSRDAAAAVPVVGRS